jgi:hypothetical protein
MKIGETWRVQIDRPNGNSGDFEWSLNESITDISGLYVEFGSWGWHHVRNVLEKLAD